MRSLDPRPASTSARPPRDPAARPRRDHRQSPIQLCPSQPLHCGPAEPAHSVLIALRRTLASFVAAAQIELRPRQSLLRGPLVRLAGLPLVDRHVHRANALAKVKSFTEHELRGHAVAACRAARATQLRKCKRLGCPDRRLLCLGVAATTSRRLCCGRRACCRSRRRTCCNGCHAGPRSRRSRSRRTSNSRPDGRRGCLLGRGDTGLAASARVLAVVQLRAAEVGGRLARAAREA